MAAARLSLQCHFLAWAINDLLRLRGKSCAVEELAPAVAIHRRLRPLADADLLRYHLAILQKARLIRMQHGLVLPPRSRTPVPWSPPA